MSATCWIGILRNFVQMMYSFDAPKANNHLISKTPRFEAPLPLTIEVPHVSIWTKPKTIPWRVVHVTRFATTILTIVVTIRNNFATKLKLCDVLKIVVGNLPLSPVASFSKVTNITGPGCCCYLHSGKIFQCFCRERDTIFS